MSLPLPTSCPFPTLHSLPESRCLDACGELSLVGHPKTPCPISDTSGMNLEPGECGMNSVSCGNGKLRQWLIDQIDSGKYPGLVWENDEKSIFRIPWKHAGKQDYNREEDAALFKVRLSLGWDCGTLAGQEGSPSPSHPCHLPLQPGSAGWLAPAGHCLAGGAGCVLVSLCLWDSPSFHHSLRGAKCFWGHSTSVSTFIPLSYAH